MTKLSWIVPVILTVGLLATTVLYAQGRVEQGTTQSAAAGPIRVAQAPGGGPGGFGRWGEMSEAERAKMREQMTERMLDQAGLPDKEKAAAKRAMKAKGQARQALLAELTKLRRIANKEKPTNAELRSALAAYGAAVAQYRKNVGAEDQALARQLSLKGQVRCMSLGILDNGLGGMGRMGMGGEMRRPGGAGQGRPAPY